MNWKALGRRMVWELFSGVAVGVGVIVGICGSLALADRLA